MDPTTHSMGGVMQRITPTSTNSGNMSQQPPPTPHSIHQVPAPPPAMQQRPSLPSPSQNRPPQQPNEYGRELQDQGPTPSSQLIKYLPPPPAPTTQNAIILAAPLEKQIVSLPPAPDVFTVEQHQPPADRQFDAHYGSQTASRPNAEYISEQQINMEGQARGGHQSVSRGRAGLYNGEGVRVEYEQKNEEQARAGQRESESHPRHETKPPGEGPSPPRQSPAQSGHSPHQQQASPQIQQRQQSTVPVPDPKIQKTPGRNPFAIPPSPSNAHPASSPGTIVTPNRRGDPTARTSTDPVAANRIKQSTTKDGITYILPPPVGKSVLVKRGSKASQSSFKVPWAGQSAGENKSGLNSSTGQGQALEGDSADQAAQGDGAEGRASQLNRQSSDEQQRISKMLSAQRAAAQKRAQAIMQSSGTEIISPARNQGQARAQDNQNRQPQYHPHATPSTPTREQERVATQTQPTRIYDPRAQKPPLPLKQHIPTEQFQAIVPKQTSKQGRPQDAKLSPKKTASNTWPQSIPPRHAQTEKDQRQNRNEPVIQKGLVHRASHKEDRVNPGGRRYSPNIEERHDKRDDRDQRQERKQDNDDQPRSQSRSQYRDRSSPSPQYGQNVQYMGHRHDHPSQGFVDSLNQDQDQDVDVDEYIDEGEERSEVNVCDYAYDNERDDQYGKQDHHQRNDQYNDQHHENHEQRGEQRIRSSKSQGKRSRDHAVHDNGEQEATQTSPSSKKRQKHEPNPDHASSETTVQEGTEAGEDEEEEGTEFDVFAETEKYDYVSELQEPWNQMMDEMVPFIDDWAEKYLATTLDTIFSVYGSFNNMSKINAESLEQGVKDILAYQDTQSEIRQTLVDFRDGVTQISKRLVSAPKSRGETPQGQAQGHVGGMGQTGGHGQE